MTIKIKGFSLIEFIMVIVILGVLAIYIAPRFNNLKDYDVKRVQSELISAIRYTQQQSMTHSGDYHYQIEITTNGFIVQKNGSTIANPLGTGDYTGDWSDGITTTSTSQTIAFNSRGNVCTSAPCTTFSNNDIVININNEEEIKRTITVEEFTGYVH